MISVTFSRGGLQDIRVYAAGNCSEPRALVPSATGTGTTAAVVINARLCFEDADRRRSGLDSRPQPLTHYGLAALPASLADASKAAAKERLGFSERSASSLDDRQLSRIASSTRPVLELPLPC